MRPSDERGAVRLKRPESYFDMLAVILTPLGAFFALLGILGRFVPLPMRGGESWVFLPAGLALLAAGGLCALLARARRRRTARLRAEGRAVPGRVVSVKEHVWVNWNTGSLAPRRRSPWTVRCEYLWEGEPYFTASALLWDRPRESGRRPAVYVDPQNPRRAWVDPESLEYERTMR